MEAPWHANNDDSPSFFMFSYAREEIQLALDVTHRLIEARTRDLDDPDAIANQLRLSVTSRKPMFTFPVLYKNEMQYSMLSKFEVSRVFRIMQYLEELIIALQSLYQKRRQCYETMLRSWLS